MIQTPPNTNHSGQLLRGFQIFFAASCEIDLRNSSVLSNSGPLSLNVFSLEHKQPNYRRLNLSKTD